MGATWPIRLNDPCSAAMRAVAIYEHIYYRSNLFCHQLLYNAQFTPPDWTRRDGPVSSRDGRCELSCAPVRSLRNIHGVASQLLLRSNIHLLIRRRDRTLARSSIQPAKSARTSDGVYGQTDRQTDVPRTNFTWSTVRFALIRCTTRSVGRSAAVVVRDAAIAYTDQLR